MSASKESESAPPTRTVARLMVILDNWEALLRNGEVDRVLLELSMMRAALSKKEPGYSL